MKRLYVTQTRDVSLGYRLPGDWTWTFAVRSRHIHSLSAFVTLCCSLFSPSLFLLFSSSTSCLQFILLFVHALFHQSINHSFIHSFIMYSLCFSFISYFYPFFFLPFRFFVHFPS